MGKLSLEYINLCTGDVGLDPVGNGVYLKTLVERSGDARAFFPTTSCLSKFGMMTFNSEMKLNLYKKSHPDFDRQRENVNMLLYALKSEAEYSTRLLYRTDKVAVVDGEGIHLPETGEFVAEGDYDIFNPDMQFRADAIITDRRHVAIVMYAADCPTAFLRDRKTGAIGVLHSMWGGLVIERDGKQSSIVKATVEAMVKQYGTNPEDLEVTIYPCISLNQFEVHNDVVEPYKKANLGEFVYTREEDEAHFVDLTGAMAEVFRRSGVPADQIKKTPFSTALYGLNSLRLAPTNFGYGIEGMTGNVQYAEIPQAQAPKLLTKKESEDIKVKSSALNFLIAIRY